MTTDFSAAVQNTSDQQGADARAQFEAWAVAQSFHASNIDTTRDSVVPEWYVSDIAAITWRAWEAALAASHPVRHVCVRTEDATNYCLILTALGMEEEGDPVEAVQMLVEARDRQPVGQEPVLHQFYWKHGEVWMECPARQVDALRGAGFEVRPLYDAPPAQAVDLLPVVKLAYGLLWMTSDDPATSTLGTLPPHVSVSRARILLRDAITHEQRGEGITSARALIDSQAGVDRG